MENKKISTNINEFRNSYYRDWRSKNKDKVKTYNKNYWAKKAINNINLSSSSIKSSATK